MKERPVKVMVPPQLRPYLAALMRRGLHGNSEAARYGRQRIPHEVRRDARGHCSEQPMSRSDRGCER